MHFHLKSIIKEKSMVCKYHEVLEFVRQHNLLNDLDDETVKEFFDIFPHACSFDKELHANELECDNPNVLETVLDKLMEILNDSFEHSYTQDSLREVAMSFCKMFEDADVPKKPIPFMVVMLSRL